MAVMSSLKKNSSILDFFKKKPNQSSPNTKGDSAKSNNDDSPRSSKKETKPKEVEVENSLEKTLEEKEIEEASLACLHDDMEVVSILAFRSHSFSHK